MSFLQDLQKCASMLRRTDTVVTCADGTRYMERRTGCSNASIVSQNATVGFVVDTAPDDVPALVIPHLYVGSQDCCAPDVLAKYDVRAVLSLGVPMPCEPPEHVRCTFRPMLDLPETSIGRIVSECSSLINSYVEQHRNVLVHCNAGVSRSITVVIGYLMLERGMSFEDAYRVVKAARPCSQPNAGFLKQLRSLH